MGIQKEFESVIRKVSEYMSIDDIENAQKCLLDFSKRYDFSNEIDVKNSIAFWEAILYKKEGKLKEAIEIFELLSPRIPNTHSSFYAMYKIYAEVLFDFGRKEESYRKYEIALENIDGASVVDLLTLFYSYSINLQQDKKQIPIKHKLRLYEIKLKLNVRSISDKPIFEDLHVMIQLLFKIHRQGNMRYSQLVLLLIDVNSIQEKIIVIENFVESENVGYYVQKAQDLLKMIKSR